MPASKNNGRPTTKPWATWLYASSPRRSGIRPCARSPQPFAKAANRGEIVGWVGTAVSVVPAPPLFSSSCILPPRLYLSITGKCPRIGSGPSRNRREVRVCGHRQRHLDHLFGGIVIQLSLKYLAKVSYAQFVAITVSIILAGFAVGAASAVHPRQHSRRRERQVRRGRSRRGSDPPEP